MFSEDLGFLDLGSHFFRGPRVFWALANIFGGRKVLDPGSCFQWMKDFRILAHVFLRTKVFRAFAHVFKGPKVLDPSSCFQRT